MQKGTLWVLIGAGVLLGGALALQFQSNRRVASEVAALREEMAGGAERTVAVPDRVSRNVPGSDNAAILRRLSALEDTVAQLVRNSEYLMERGQLPVSTNRVADFVTKFMDANASDRERVQALRLLRRSGGITDETLLHAVNWAQGATNAGTRDDILSSLEGMTNSILRDPLLGFALNDPNPSVREQAVDSLRRYVNDPAIEAQFWKLINDPDVGRTAIQGILDGPKTEARMAALQERANNPSSSLEEKIVAWRALRTSSQNVQEITANLAQLAQSSQDPFERAKLIKAFDVSRPTPRDAVLLPTLIQGLQDASPIVREPAAGALRGYAADPTVQKWLRWAAENDPDQGVRKAAANAVMSRR